MKAKLKRGQIGGCQGEGIPAKQSGEGGHQVQTSGCKLGPGDVMYGVAVKVTSTMLSI